MIFRKHTVATFLALYLALFPAAPAFAQEAETRTLQNLEYEYDALGNITRIIDSSETDTAKTSRYTYDDLSRLIEAATENAANGDNYTQNYTYSPTGNLIRHSAIGDYTYGGRHPQAVTEAGNTNYEYDVRGNLTGDGTWAHAYDYRNRLINSTNGDTVIDYTYNNSNERIKKDDGENTTIYISDEYEIRDGVEIVHVFADGTRVATIKDGVITFNHPDHLTGANVSTDENGQVTEVADYYPYGEDRISESAETPTPYRFTDQEKDTETGLYYYGARYYNPLIGRFISLDPWQGDTADPQSLNKYSYARNNPVKYIDPSGNVFQLAIGAAAFAFAWFSSYEYANAPGPNTQIQSRNGTVAGLENMPGTGDVADAYGAVAGRTLSGEKLSKTDRLLYVGATVGQGVTGPMLKSAGKVVSDKIDKIIKAIEKLVGKDAKMIKNKHGDPVIVDQNNTARVRFDVNNTKGDKPHGHIEIKKNGEWQDATSKHRIYLKEE